jgi:hypothetical protein
MAMGPRTKMEIKNLKNDTTYGIMIKVGASEGNLRFQDKLSLTREYTSIKDLAIWSQ